MAMGFGRIRCDLVQTQPPMAFRLQYVTTARCL